MLLSIQSRDNDKIKYARKLAESASFRAQERLFLAEGRRLCFDLAQTLRVHSAFATEAFLQSCPEAEALAPQCFVISEPVAQKLADTQTPQGLFCLFETPLATIEAMDAEKGVLLCETLQDPANVGATLRSAAAFGFGGVVLVGCADPFGPKALRAGMGAVGHVAVKMLPREGLAQAAEQLVAKKATIYAAALQNARPLPAVAVKRPFALLVGNEGAGLTAEALALAAETVYIPMQNGVESLNAAVAASVLMFHFST